MWPQPAHKVPAVFFTQLELKKSSGFAKTINGLSNFVVFIGGGEEALTGKSKLRAAILSAALSA